MTGMKDQYFGVEVEMTGITREQAAQALADYFGTIPQYKGGVYDAWVVKDTENKEWKLMSDGSIRAERKTLHGYEQTNNRQYKVEMVSPKLTYAELPKFQECVRQIRHAGAKVNSSCGLHIHVDAANHNRQSLKNLLSIMYAKEDILFKALQVNEARAARWCQKVREPMLRQARTLSAEETKDLTQLESIWYEGDVSAGEHYNWTRYYALNLHSVFYRGTVEWRCFNSTLHAGRAAAYINLCLAMSAQAIAQRSTVMRKTHSDNELFTFRVWLVRLGLNGPEFKNTRDHLLANLDGDRAWRYDKDSYEVNKKKKNRIERWRGDEMKIQMEEDILSGTGTEIMDQLRARVLDPTEFPDTESYIWFLREQCGAYHRPGLSSLPEGDVEQQARHCVMPSIWTKVGRPHDFGGLSMAEASVFCLWQQYQSGADGTPAVLPPRWLGLSVLDGL